jgi:hypothetical protein
MLGRIQGAKLLENRVLRVNVREGLDVLAFQRTADLFDKPLHAGCMVLAARRVQADCSA